MQKTFTFNSIPASAEELSSLAGTDASKDAFHVAALSILAFCRYMEDEESGISMLNSLKGPEPLSEREKQFLRDRKREGHSHVPRSYLLGSAPDNNYTPSVPYQIAVSDNPYSYQTDDFARLLLQSGGADSQRTITLRHKPSTDEWFLWEWMGLLSGIRTPAASDPWA